MKTAPTITATNPVGEFTAAMIEAGVETTDPITPDGKLHRVHVRGDKKAERSGWYVLFLNGLPAGAFGDWRSGEKGTWCGRGSDEQTLEERAAFRLRMDEARVQREAEERARHEEARQKAEAIWAEAKPAPADYRYLFEKGIKPHGAKVDSEGNLIVLLRDAAGQTSTLELITPWGGQEISIWRPKAS